jgi:hypothetical protein
MTKIAIVPNAAGTGTFTIEAPNSNSNRTLTLPDAAGEIYGQGNILGTVSQSGGVPTGAIIERGSNANGEFVKYADGTMICSILRANALNGTPTLSAAPIHFSADQTWTYPAAFVVKPAIALNGERSSSDATAVWAATRGATTTTATVRAYSTLSSAVLGFDIHAIAIGRWF